LHFKTNLAKKYLSSKQ